MHSDLAPRSYGRIIDSAFELYRANFRTIALASLLVLFPFAMLVGVTQVFSTRGVLTLIGTFTDPNVTEAMFFQEYSQLQMLSLLSNMVTPLFLLAQIYITSSLVTVAPGMLAGQRPGVKEMLFAGKSRFLWLVLATLGVTLAKSVGYVLVIIPGVILLARLSVVPMVTVAERASIDQAFTRSWNLTRSRFWRTIGFFIVVFVISVVLEAAIDSPAVIRQIVASVNNPEAIFQELSPGWQTFEGALAATSTALIHPFATLCWFFYYLDLRARSEGLDLVMAARPLAEKDA